MFRKYRNTVKEAVNGLIADDIKKLGSPSDNLISGKVSLGEGTVLENCRIEGTLTAGSNCVIRNVIVAEGYSLTVGNNCCLYCLYLVDPTDQRSAARSSNDYAFSMRFGNDAFVAFTQCYAHTRVAEMKFGDRALLFMLEVIYNGVSESDSSIGDDAFLLRSYIDVSPCTCGAAEIGNGLELVDVNVDFNSRYLEAGNNLTIVSGSPNIQEILDSMRNVLQSSTRNLDGFLTYGLTACFTGVLSLSRLADSNYVKNYLELQARRLTIGNDVELVAGAKSFTLSAEAIKLGHRSCILFRTQFGYGNKNIAVVVRKFIVDDDVSLSMHDPVLKGKKIVHMERGTSALWSGKTVYESRDSRTVVQSRGISILRKRKVRRKVYADG